ncbi:SPOR domain-containing protein [Balneola vulgaris]|uniref:SPOR domain-containing protein n=1 Tax=Balneola vulgaris TaxID=287535 RepID=UPI00036D462C|nr:SPOR domain-containing protein [Balneola vulgaris]
MKQKTSSLLLILSVLVLACSSSSQTIDTPSDSPSANEGNTTETTEGNNDTAAPLISSLSDSYAAYSNDIPAEYKEIKKVVEEEVDLTRGFRVQIYSGESVTRADTIASQFRAWADTSITGYQAETYTFFKTPYYRVHVGDFHDRDFALEYSKLVKRVFKDAWVVYDKVNPWSVASDTLTITLIEQ